MAPTDLNCFFWFQGKEEEKEVKKRVRRWQHHQEQIKVITGGQRQLSFPGAST